MKNYTVIIVAGGNSSRFNQKENKLLYKINDTNTVIEKTLALFLSDPFCTEIIVGVNGKILNFLGKKNYQDHRLHFVMGGRERVDTIYHCLINHKIKNEMVMIHDGVRCFVSLNLVNKLNQTFCKKNYEVLIPMLPITEALKKVNNYLVEETINRNEYFTIQTPQVFTTTLLYNVYEEYFRTKNSKIIYDDSYLVELFAKKTKIHTILGEKQNIKITYPEDLKLLNLGK
ncbi:IspD/TarI family cytidylyltransferase [Spiroplasma sp. SV19]|uniref:IspD/TarI family cytidylyltransferase n=1 Tax=Spiroplasma sp. SV19 TaxID=2570468 RepID=UPI0024B6EAEA|nr:IspD/TarI family cytidylyltransferase [Spiroplasma sp. SV19]WHQ37132.1 2-C-methyl-D-erythritol 4-phosphate cytidylyltransferase [Spiroplasma sp. SV19]